MIDAKFRWAAAAMQLLLVFMNISNIAVASTNIILK